MFKFTVRGKRRRCGACDGCTAEDCGECRFCIDKPKFGGKGVLKQACIFRSCKRTKVTLEGMNIHTITTWLNNNYVNLYFVDKNCPSFTTNGSRTTAAPKSNTPKSNMQMFQSRVNECTLLLLCYVTV